MMNMECITRREKRSPPPSGPFQRSEVKVQARIKTTTWSWKAGNCLQKFKYGIPVTMRWEKTLKENQSLSLLLEVRTVKGF